jgi:hypothetical protein
LKLCKTCDGLIGQLSIDSKCICPLTQVYDLLNPSKCKKCKFDSICSTCDPNDTSICTSCETVTTIKINITGGGGFICKCKESFEIDLVR